MQKIGFVIPWFGENIPGGAEMELREVTAHLQQAGMEVEILTTCVKEFTADWNENYYAAGTAVVGNITVRRFPVRRRGYPSARRFRKQPNAAGRCSVRLCRWFPCRMQEQMRTAPTRKQEKETGFFSLLKYLLETESDLFTSPTDLSAVGCGTFLRRLFCKGANSDAVPVYKKNNISKQQGQPGFALKL